jgi:hypothetical protein
MQVNDLVEWKMQWLINMLLATLSQSEPCGQNVLVPNLNTLLKMTFSFCSAVAAIPWVHQCEVHFQTPC